MRWVSAIVLLVTAACSSPSRTSGSPVVVVVPGPVGAYASVTVVAGARQLTLTGDARDRVVPLVGARSFTPSEPMSTYGLDQPQAVLTYRRVDGTGVELAVGGTTFDHHFVYVQRAGQATVALVAADRLGPALAEVGITLPPPT